MQVPSSTTSRGEVGFNMTPMIDIVFLLIIFFIVSSHLARQETQLELALPAASSHAFVPHALSPGAVVRRAAATPAVPPTATSSTAVGWI